MTDPRPSDTFRERSAAETAADKQAQRLVFDLLARGEITQAEIRRMLMRDGHHPWRVGRAPRSLGPLSATPSRGPWTVPTPD